MRRGFTILEVLVASSILAIGSLGVLGMLITTIENNRASRLRTDAVIIAEQQLADMEAISLMGNANGNAIAGTLYQAVRTRQQQNNCTWTHWRNVDQHGVVRQNNNNNIYSIGYTCLPEVANIAPQNMFIRGAIRVTWSKTGSWDNGKCTQRYDRFDTLESRQDTNTRECDFVTLPFAFRTSPLAN